jgi:hypothetical protein
MIVPRIPLQCGGVMGLASKNQNDIREDITKYQTIMFCSEIFSHSSFP